jgi:hypothetical protein
MNLFELATRKKFKFASTKGLITVEDLWDLPLTSNSTRANLDDIARDLFKQLRNGDTVSFVNSENKSDPTVQAQFDVVKYIIDVKLLEKQEDDKARSKAKEKQQLLEILAERQHDELKSKSVDEIKALIAAL